MIESTNNEVIVNNIDWPLNPKFPFPLDVRQFFSNIEDANTAAASAVMADVIRDEYGDPIGTIIPSEEEGGRDTVYYFGEPIVVVNADRTEGTMYIIVKDSNTNEGVLLEVGALALKDYMKTEDAEALMRGIAVEEIGKLDVDTLQGMITTGGYDGCNNFNNLNGIFIRGLKEVDGKIELDDVSTLVVAFDPESPYGPNNPLATRDTVNRIVANLKQEYDEVLSNVETQISSQGSEIISLIENASSFYITMIDSMTGLEISPYQMLGDVLQNISFIIISQDTREKIVSVTINSGANERTYLAPQPYSITCNWDYDVRSTTDFNITIKYENDTFTDLSFNTKIRIIFVTFSAYGVMKYTEYEDFIRQHDKIESNSELFKHAYDINGLDYIDCYSFYALKNEEYEEFCERYADRFVKIGRSYDSNFETEFSDGLDIDERIFVLSQFPRTTYLYVCALKEDPCRINNFKQTFTL